MKINFSGLKDKFLEKGYLVCKKKFTKNFVDDLILEIDNSKDTIKYFDNHNNLRRIEKLYNKGNQLNKFNNEILILLKKIFDKEFLIFKDKFNAKPPGGEGFFAHYDGIFNFIDFKNNKRNGWYEYGNYFLNVLIALDECNKENGTIELAKAHKGSFNDLLKNTKNDGTPALTKEIESHTSFDLIHLNVGDIVIFSNTCPHRSKKNNSNKNRRVLYYTYSLRENGSKYEEYFEDKEKSKNPSKALVDKK